MIDYRLYLVTDDPSRYSGDWLENVVASVEGGVTCVQYRDTESPSGERLARLRRLQDALRERKTPLVVNNDAVLAAAIRADGVHVGQADMPPAQVRALVGPTCEIGLSITAIAQLAALDAPPIADCLGIGPVFDARKTKFDASDAMGVDGLSDVIAAMPPLRSVAIGGITLGNAAQVLSTGVGGIAVVSAFSKAEDPYAVARSFRRLFT